MRACGGDIWSLCSDVLPDVLRVKSCVANKMGQLSKGCLDKLLDVMAGAQFKVCKDQTYALCAAARCNVLDGVAYCQCDVKYGDSISLPFPMGKDEDVCSINAAGADNKYMVSTYSLPEAIVAPQRRPGDLHLPGRKLRRRLRPVRRRSLLQKHRGDDVPRLRQARAEGPDRLFLPHHSGQPGIPRKAIQSSGLTLATSPSSNIARAPPPTARRVRQSMSAPLLARPRLWPSSSTAKSRRSTSASLKGVSSREARANSASSLSLDRERLRPALIEETGRGWLGGRSIATSRIPSDERRFVRCAAYGVRWDINEPSWKELGTRLRMPT